MSGQWQYQRFASIFSRIYSSKHNPLYHLAPLSIFTFLIAFITGIYLFLFFKIDPRQAYSSTQEISNQWIGGIVRSLHRYSSDLMIVLVLLHLVHMLITGKFRRAVSWLSGVGSLWIVWLIGLTGFMMVWDHKSKLLGILASKLFSSLPIFPDSLTGGFMMNDTSSLAGYFRMILFGHLALSVLTFIIIWIHVMHLSRPKLIPSKYLMAITGIALLIICVFFQVKSDPSAESSIAPYAVTFDWYFLSGFHFMKSFSPGMNWVFILIFITAISVFACIRRPKFAPAKVDLDKCDACEQCAHDCPYNAIDILELNGERKAILDESKCLSCGICIGSCKGYAIDMPGMPEIKELISTDKKELAILSCRFIPSNIFPRNTSVTVHTIPCVGDLHARKVSDFFNGDVKGVMLVSCEDCYHRFGLDIEMSRMERKRRPTLSRKYSIERLRFIHSSMNMTEEITSYLNDLKNADDRKGINELNIRTHKPKLVLGALFWGLLICALPLISSVPTTFYTKDHGVLVLNFKYTSTAISVMAESNSSLKHMQQKIAIATKRSPIEILVFNEVGKIIYQKIFQPKGLHQDMSVYIYDEVDVTGKIKIQMTETEFKDKKFETEYISLDKGHGAVIGFEEGRLKVLAAR